MSRTTYNSMPVSSHRFTWSSPLLKSRLGVLLLVVLATFTSSAPIKGPATSPARWKNPCTITGHLFDPEADMTGAPNITKLQLFQEIIDAATKAYLNGKEKKNEFVKEAFDENEFESGVEENSEDWLPKIPEITKEHLDSLETKEAFRETYGTLQYFAVGLEQAVLDQLGEKKFLRLFRDAENDLIAMLCELQRVMTILGIKSNPDVDRLVMKQERRGISGETYRNIRDYFILRDYITAADYVVKVFEHLKSKL